MEEIDYLGTQSKLVPWTETTCTSSLLFSSLLISLDWRWARAVVSSGGPIDGAGRDGRREKEDAEERGRRCWERERIANVLTLAVNIIFPLIYFLSIYYIIRWEARESDLYVASFKEYGSVWRRKVYNLREREEGSKRVREYEVNGME